MNLIKKNILYNIFFGAEIIITTLSAQELNVNRIMIPLTNIGTIDLNNPLYANNGAQWKEWDENYFSNAIVYTHGLWVTAKRNGAYGCTPTLWNTSYSPGPIINGLSGNVVNHNDSARYRVYKIRAGDTPESNPDFSQWPVDLGAPVDEYKNPKILGDQTAWMVYNGADTTLEPYFFNRRNLTPRALLPIEIRHTVFEHFSEFEDTTIWANTVFFEWAIYNKGPDRLDSVYFSFWTDIDFLDYSYNAPGVDTTSQLGYCWYTKDSSAGSVGYSLLFGPTVPSPGSISTYFGKQKQGFKNLPLTTFWGIDDDSNDDDPDGPPWSLKTTWNVIRGLSKAGNPIINPETNTPTNFLYSGDPITKQGILWPKRINGGGAGFHMSTGPITMAPGDSQWIMMALIPSVKLNSVDAINRMRTNAQYLRSLPYDSLVALKPRQSIPPKKDLPTFTGPAAFQLYKNYPNPFNAETIIPFDLPEISRVYIEIFDVLGRSVAVFPDRIFAKGSDHSVRWIPAVAGGVYFIQVKAVSMESRVTWSGLNKVVLLR